VGSIDIDLVVDPGIMDAERYATIVELLRDRGYEPAGESLFQFEKVLRSPRDGQDYLIRSWDNGDDFKFQVFDITSRDTDPSKISLVSEITGTTPNSCGRGCGGDFMYRAHKGYWSQDSGYYYASAGEPGFRNTSLQIFDLKDPKNPKWVGRAWFPGMKDTEDKALYQNQYVHHPVVDEQNNRMYLGGRGSGLLGAWDITDRANPKMVWMYDVAPPEGGPHTITPIVYNNLPYHTAPALPRKFVMVTDETSNCRTGIMANTCCSAVKVTRSRRPGTGAVQDWRGR